VKLRSGLTVRYCLSRSYRIEGPSFGFVRQLLRGGPFGFDHFAFCLQAGLTKQVPVNSFSIWPVASNVLEFLGSLDEPPLAAGLIIRARFVVFELVDGVARHFPSPLGRRLGGRRDREGRGGFAQANLDQPTDRFRTSRSVLLPRRPCVDLSDSRFRPARADLDALTSSGAAAMFFGTNLFCWLHFIWYQKIMPKGSANFR
jgi:hypothetical protein